MERKPLRELVDEAVDEKIKAFWKDRKFSVGSRV